jgi:two-component system chemotaxis sensor kinase CheA
MKAGITMSGEEEAAHATEDETSEVTTAAEFLLVEVAGRRAAVPLGDVLRIEQIAVKRIEYVGLRPVINFDGQLLPVDDTAGVLAAAEDNPEMQIVVVVCRDGNRHVGIAVSHVLDVATGADLVEAGTSVRTGGVTLLKEYVTGVVNLGAIGDLPAEASPSGEWNSIAEAVQ